MDSSTSGGLKTVLITGGTDGLGRAAATLLAGEGYRVFAAGRNPEKRAALEQFAEEHKLSLETIDLDVTSDPSADRAIAEVERRAGPVDVLVNNAGIAIAAAMEEITLADLHKQYETNIFGVLRMTQRVLPPMRARRHGLIVNMSSIAGRVANPLMGAYSSSKHALEAISDALRLEVTEFGIGVVLIEPGFIRTNIARAGAELSSRYMNGAASSPYARVYLGFLKMWQKTASGSKATPEDCARTILRAISSPRPRPRYTVTPQARLMVLLRRLLPDRSLDRMTLRMLALDHKQGARPSPEAMRAELEALLRS